MYKVTKRINFCYGHRLLKYAGKCRHLHGHNAIAELDVAAETLDEIGFVRDFGDIKHIIKSWIDATLDHRMILCRDDPLVAVLQEHQEEIFLVNENPTAEVIAKMICDYATSQKIPVTEVRLWETPDAYATYIPPPHS